MKTYLVTGAAGFIGASIARELLSRGNKIVTVDNLSTGSRNSIPKGVDFIQGDCQDQMVIEALRHYEFEAIFHIAGQSSGEISFEKPIYDLQTNTQSTLQLLDLARLVGCKKFIYASTMSIYGDTDCSFVDETNKTHPKSFYGVGKLASEHYLRIHNNEFGIATAALRLFNVYGPGQNLTNMKQGMVSIFLAQAIESQKIHVRGSGTRFRDFIYIDDVVKAFLDMEVVLEDRKNHCVNVCTGIKTTVNELVKSITSHLHSKITVKYDGSTPGDQAGIFGDPSKMHKIIGYWEKVKLDDGIERFISSVKGKIQ